MRDPANLVKTKRGYMDAYLIEVRSLGGLSGSPVTVPLEPSWIADRRKHTPVEGAMTCYLLGMIHGHFVLEDPENDIVHDLLDKQDACPVTKQVADEFNSGIAVVIPIDKILETINQEALVRRREEFVQKDRDRS